MSGDTVTVGEATRLTGVSAKAIRWYGARGLFPRTAAGVLPPARGKKPVRRSLTG